MKLLVQGDDFGFTKAVTYGIIDAVENGVLRNTGLFSNMPSAELAASFIKDHPAVCFGIDFNLVSGPPVSDPKDIPHLVDENGDFIRSGVRVRDPRWQSEEGRREMFPWEETYREIKAQYDRFIELTGKKPGYLHGHSIIHEHYTEAIRKLSADEGIPYSSDIQKQYHFCSPRMMKAVSSKASQNKIFDPAEQLAKDPLKDIQELAEKLLSEEYVCIGGHPGFVDGDLLDLTTLSLERVRDHQMMTSDWIKQWIRDNDIELITYYDLY
ncbi:MAG TPA: hypothetical protein DCG51_02980 [Erysipelotrichaceae bacterium]|nr:hypothetical protein [Erysipelotrichaceae bacterium]